jgi:aldose 1-epimerase
MTEPNDLVQVHSSDGATGAKFVPAANMLCCSLTHRGTEFLDAGHGVEAYAGHGKTMGIPLLHPWANRLAGFEYRVAGKHVTLPRDGAVIPVDGATGLPIHGVIPSLLRWDVESVIEGALAARLRWDSPQLLDLFPFAHELVMEVALDGAGLTIATTLIATGAEAVPVSFGFHPYLRLPDAPRETWRISTSALAKLALDEHMIPTGERVPLERREFELAEESLDDAFEALSEPVEFAAVAAGKAVRARFTDGFTYAQIYAPPEKQFICFEPMTAPTNALNSGDGLRIVPPGERLRTVLTISVS